MKSFKISVWMLLSAGVLWGQDFDLQWEQEIRGRSGSGVALGDVDGDGDVDAVLCQSTDDSVLLLNDGSGFFAKAEVWLMPKCTDGELADLDGDGDLDFFWGQHLGECGVSWNDGSGVFTESGVTFATEQTFGVAFGDLDGDDDLDLFVVNGNQTSGFRGNEVWVNDGSGGFTSSGQDLGDDYSFDVLLHDVDGDWDLDAVEGTNVAFENHLWVNDGSGNFSEGGIDLGDARVIELVREDLNGDGREDFFAVANQEPSEVWFGGLAPDLLFDSGQRLGGVSS